MSVYAKILVPIDSSEESGGALNEAIRMAKQRRSALCLLHVIKLPAPVYDYGYGETIDLERLTDSMRQLGIRQLNEAEATARGQGLVPRCVLCESKTGSSADEILSQARQWQANLIVMASHAQKSGVHVSLETATVLAESPVPVLLVRGVYAPINDDIKPGLAARPCRKEQWRSVQ